MGRAVEVEQVAYHDELPGVEVAGDEDREPVRVGHEGVNRRLGREPVARRADLTSDLQAGAHYGGRRVGVALRAADKGSAAAPQLESLDDRDRGLEIDLQHPRQPWDRSAAAEQADGLGQDCPARGLGPAVVEREPDERREPRKQLHRSPVGVEQQIPLLRAPVHLAQQAVEHREIAPEEGGGHGIVSVRSRQPLEQVVTFAFDPDRADARSQRLGAGQAKPQPQVTARRRDHRGLVHLEPVITIQRGPRQLAAGLPAVQRFDLLQQVIQRPRPELQRWRVGGAVSRGVGPQHLIRPGQVVGGDVAGLNLGARRYAGLDEQPAPLLPIGLAVQPVGVYAPAGIGIADPQRPGEPESTRGPETDAALGAGGDPSSVVSPRLQRRGGLGRPPVDPPHQQVVVGRASDHDVAGTVDAKVVCARDGDGLIQGLAGHPGYPGAGVVTQQ